LGAAVRERCEAAYYSDDVLTEGKRKNLEALSDARGVIAALAMDQRGALEKPLAMACGVAREEITPAMMAEFKAAVIRTLSPYATAVLLDPDYGMDAVGLRAPGKGLLLNYEADNFENPRPHKMPALLPYVSARRLKEWGANGVKVLISYTPFDDAAANDAKHAFVERIGCECAAADVPFFLEFVGYDAAGGDESGVDFARRKPEIVVRSMEEFSKDVYGVDVMKVQVPVNVAFVEGSAVYGGAAAYTYAEALEWFRRASSAAGKPFIYLSAGVSHREFTESLRMAAEAGADFSGVLCGRATWKDGIPLYAKHGLAAFEGWLKAEGVRNIQAINDRLKDARPWHNKPAMAATR
jgi:tagatose 1,6-diphosphate aldolase